MLATLDLGIALGRCLAGDLAHLPRQPEKHEVLHDGEPDGELSGNAVLANGAEGDNPGEDKDVARLPG